MQELSDRVNAALESCRDLPQGSRPLLVSHGIALGCPVSTILDYQHGQSVAYVCVTVLFRAWIIRKACGWRLAGSLKPQGTSRIWTPLH